MVTGIDYLTGEKNVPINELKVLTAEEPDSDTRGEVAKRSDLFPDDSAAFKRFAAKFVYKYGVSTRMRPPILLRPESIERIRSQFEAVNGRIMDPETERVGP